MKLIRVETQTTDAIVARVFGKLTDANPCLILRIGNSAESSHADVSVFTVYDAVELADQLTSAANDLRAAVEDAQQAIADREDAND
jgi:hypothetical protein